MSEITVQLDRTRPAAPLTFLQYIRPSEISQRHEGIEWPTFDKVRERLRVALPDVVEPGWREKRIETWPKPRDPSASSWPLMVWDFFDVARIELRGWNDERARIIERHLNFGPGEPSKR